MKPPPTRFKAISPSFLKPLCTEGSPMPEGADPNLYRHKNTIMSGARAPYSSDGAVTCNACGSTRKPYNTEWSPPHG